MQLATLAVAFGVAKQKLEVIKTEADTIERDPNRHLKYGRSHTLNMVYSGYKTVNDVAYAVALTKSAWGLNLVSERDVSLTYAIRIQKEGDGIVDTVAKGILEKFGLFNTAKEIGLKFTDHKSSELVAIVADKFDPSLYLV